MSLKSFHIVFIIFSTLLALGTGVWCIWVDLVEGAPIYLAGAIAAFVTAFAILILFVFSPVGQALACPFCYGAKDGKSTEHMAVAIWFLFGAVISVLGGIGAFSFHLWRHGRMPAEPYQEITEEDLSKY